MPKQLTGLTPLAPGVVDRLARISSGTLTTELFRRGLKQCYLVGLTPLNPSAPSFAGEAYTLRMIAAREDVETYSTLTPYPNEGNLQWEAVENIEAGQVLVIDSRSDPRAASAGDILLNRMQAKGVAGVVTDGAFRDGREIATMDLPAYCRQVTASTRLSFHHVADLNVPITCADVAVYPGDIIVGDGDGITVVPRQLAEEIADAGEKRDALEAYIALRVKGGEGLYGLYPPTDQIRADHAAWAAAGANPEDAPRIRAERTDG